MKQQINLYQPMFRPRKTVLPAMVIAQLFGLVLLFLGAVYAAIRFALPCSRQ